jgi:hypothetical protein
MTAKEYLSQYTAAASEIEALIDEKQRLRSLAEKKTISFESDGGASGSVNADKIPAAVEKIIEIEKEIGERIVELATLRIEIYTTICKVKDGKHRVLLLKRYIGNESFERISNDIGFTYNHIIRVIHPEALADIEKILAK